jgi:hypothetical protein
MGELVEWLRAQLDEDERIAWDACGPGNRWYAAERGGPIRTQEDRDAAHVEAWEPARVLREIDAKRRLLALHTEGASELFCAHCEHEPPCPTLRLLALPYANRPGYREEWRP